MKNKRSERKLAVMLTTGAIAILCSACLVRDSGKASLEQQLESQSHELASLQAEAAEKALKESIEESLREEMESKERLQAEITKTAAETTEAEVTEAATEAAEAAAMETAATITAAAEYKTMFVVNCNESITLRTSPNTKAAEICQIKLGQPVSFIESAANGFYRIVYQGKEGFALASYLGEVPGESRAGELRDDNYYVYQAYGTDTMWVVNCNESITLRAKPSTSAAEICQIPLFARVTVKALSDNGFLKVSYNGRQGYALASYLDVMEPQTAIGLYAEVVNCNESITLRQRPSTSAGEICQIPLGATVYCYSWVNDDFYRVRYNGQEGYALSGYLRIIQ